MANRKLEAVLELHDLGWCIVPAKGKMPIGSWKHRQTERPTRDELEDEFSEGNPNAFVITGAISGICVLDCDDQAAVAWWRERLGPVLDETACATTGKGKHYYFKLPEGERRKGRSSPGGASGAWDLRAEGGGVVVPPSIHHSGVPYRWVRKRGPSAIKEAPAGLWPDRGSSNEKEARSTLTALLESPPAEGQRNVWLAQVAGHLAVTTPYRDAFDALVREVAPAGLEEQEVDKLIESIWSAEQAKKGKALPTPAVTDDGGGDWRVTEPTEDSGYLVSGDTRILVQKVDRDDEGGKVKTLGEWLNADMRVESVFIEEEERTFTVEIRDWRGGKHYGSLNSKILGNNTKLKEWLIGHGVSLASANGMFPQMGTGERLSRYLEIQDAPTATPAQALGWNDEAKAFVTHEGLIRDTGWHPYDTVRPHPDIRNWAPYEYGMEGGFDGEASGILREVLTYHDETVTAVFGSWWAACFLKAQIQEAFSLFPVMAIEAPSESGKSTGFFPTLLRLSGNLQLNSQVTKAALRDYLSAHRNGITWLDDHDEVVELEELIRAVTVEGAVVKKAIDHNKQKSTKMRGALCVSGESLGFRNQKALADRSIHLEVPNPRGRRSTKGDYPQFEDILRMNKDHLQQYAGAYVARALGLAPKVDEWAKELRGKGGRHEDKLSIVLLGARILERLTEKEDSEYIKRVEGWAGAERESYVEEDNSLTSAILPKILRDIGEASRPRGPDPERQQKATPVFVLNDRVWFSPALVADYWDKARYGKIKARTESLEAIRQQAIAAGAGGKKNSRYFEWETVSLSKGGCQYKRLPPDVGRSVIERSKDGSA